MVERSRSFGAAAAAYDRHRPGYPVEALAWGLAPAPGRAVLDLGAGTGKVTTGLLALPGTTVVAVDPDPAMLAQLSSRLPDVDTRVGVAESIPLPDASVDAVTVGQAWHWFDHARAGAEIARVLRPGGVVAVVWNDEDPDATWLHGAYEAMHRGQQPRMGATASDDHPTGEPFAAPERRTFPNPVETTVDGVIDTVATHSWALIADAGERDAALGRLRAHLAARPETAGATFMLPLVTTVARTARR